MVQLRNVDSVDRFGPLLPQLQGVLAREHNTQMTCAVQKLEKGTKTAFPKKKARWLFCATS